MINIQSVSDSALLTTVRIEVDKPHKTEVGTGFLFEYPAGESSDACRVIFTNKHLVKDSSEGRMLFKLSEGTGNEARLSENSYRVALKDFESRWIGHTNGDIDLCAMPLEEIDTTIKQASKEPFHMLFKMSNLPTKEDLAAMYAVEEILMVGYPIGVWDSHNNLPIFRRGITATPPDIDFDGSPYGLIDVACMPGSSGSPILIIRESPPTSPIRNTSGGFYTFPAGILLGVHDRKVNWDSGGNVNISHSTKQVSQLPAHLGFYIKSSEIRNMEMIIRHSLKSEERNLAWEYDDT